MSESVYVFPASFAQRRLWFLDQLSPGSPLYNVPAIPMISPLDVGILERAINAIVDRHESLRTTFDVVDGEPVQVIAPSLRVAVAVLDLRHLPERERELEMQRLAQEEAQKPFDLATGPLIRPVVAHLDDRQSLFLLTTHHIISDGWSMDIFMQELVALYSAFARGEPSPLPELPIQYADYAVWQHEMLQGEALEGHLDYWRRQLDGLPALNLPLDHPRPPVQSYHGDRLEVGLSETLIAGLKALSRRQGVTLFMTMLAAFQVLLARHTGQDDVVVGTPVAGRGRAELERLIGFFVNTLVIRTDLSGNPTFLELLERVRRVTLDAYAHQELPFERLVEELQPERDLSRNPLFQVSFQLQHLRGGEGQGAGGLHVAPGTAVFDLSVNLGEHGSGIGGYFEFNTDLFERETVARLIERYETLLAGIVAAPERRLSGLPFLPEREREQLLTGWNRTERAYPVSCLHELFEAQVARTPDALAVVLDDGRTGLSYAALDDLANRLTRRLRAVGVTAESLVGICMEPSLEMVVGFLGTLKAGGAYVPLPPEAPRERLAAMVADAGLRAILVQPALADRLPAGEGAVLRLDDRWELPAAESGGRPAVLVSPEQLAYVLYTSGSTGAPKGAMITHRAVCNHMQWMQDAFPLGGDDRVLQRTPFSFDASIWEFYAPLLAGARLIIARKEGQRDPHYLVQQMIRHRITVLQVVPVLLRMLLEEPHLVQCRHLRHLFCGGEALPAEYGEWFAGLLGAGLHNLYGPTETAIDATIWSYRQGERGQTAPIGRPIANVRAYVLAPDLTPAPTGVPGELFLGGEGLGRGYLGRPDLTAETFVPDPFSARPGARLYRTGDLVRYRADGTIEFLGRTDQQVKIRGYRVEIGEIEAVLRRHPAVRESCVVVSEATPGDRRLVAYVVPHRPLEPSGRDLRLFLQETLPDYMVPSAYVLLDELPLLPNGKVDRRRLPPPDNERPDWAGDFVAPHTPVEEVLAAVWVEVLNRDRVGVYDNFFTDLGGHSLLATQLVSRLRDLFRIEIPLQRIFEAQTVSDFAAALLRNGSERAQIEKTAALLLELERLSEREVESLLSNGNRGPDELE